jgi:hypothetical protein
MVRVRTLKGVFGAGPGNLRLPAKALRSPGSYRLTVKATASATESVAVVIAFKVVSKRHR